MRHKCRHTLRRNSEVDLGSFLERYVDLGDDRPLHQPPWCQPEHDPLFTLAAGVAQRLEGFVNQRRWAEKQGHWTALRQAAATWTRMPASPMPSWPRYCSHFSFEWLECVWYSRLPRMQTNGRPILGCGPG